MATRVRLTRDNVEYFNFALGDRVTRRTNSSDRGMIVDGWSDVTPDGPAFRFEDSYEVKRPDGSTYRAAWDELVKES